MGRARIWQVSEVDLLQIEKDLHRSRCKAIAELPTPWSKVRPSAPPRLPLGCPSAGPRLALGWPSAGPRLALGWPTQFNA